MGLYEFVVQARLAQSVERQALNLMVVGSSPTVGVFEKQSKAYVLLDYAAFALPRYKIPAHINIAWTRKSEKLKQKNVDKKFSDIGRVGTLIS